MQMEQATAAFERAGGVLNVLEHQAAIKSSITSPAGATALLKDGPEPCFGTINYLMGSFGE